MPAIGLEALGAILRESQISGSSKRNVVVVIDINQFAQFEMARETRGFRGDAFHQIAVANDSISKVIDDFEPRAVVTRRQVGLSDRHADAVAETLAERPRGCFHSRCKLALGMSRGAASPLAKLFDVVKGNIVNGQMK